MNCGRGWLSSCPVPDPRPPRPREAPAPGRVSRQDFSRVEKKTSTFRFPPFLSVLECSGCGATLPPERIHTYCPDCHSPILARYDLDAARQRLDRDSFRFRRNGMWRWYELLPVVDPEQIVSLGEGDCPLLRLVRVSRKLGLPYLFVKDESANPTGSFKARGLSAAVSKARELGIRKVIIPTAGNAGGAMAAYAARADMEALIYFPKDTPHANIAESRMAGARIVLVDGLISDAAGVAGETARRDGWFDLSTFKEPYRVEGKKIMGYELAEAFQWELPDVIIYPTGGGTGLVGMWKAFLEMESLGWLKQPKKPRMVAVQAEGCAPVVKAFEAGATFCDYWVNAHTLASGLRVPKSFADQLILKDIRESGGTALAVSDESITKAQHELCEMEGIFSAPEGAATLAALEELVRRKWVGPDERVVLFNTGSGLKYLDPPGDSAEDSNQVSSGPVTRENPFRRLTEPVKKFFSFNR
ncbi:MAG: threonine synthase [Anaerolineales bacterium]|nr:threonine synthase [Anaerolineales bacterium]